MAVLWPTSTPKLTVARTPNPVDHSRNTVGLNGFSSAPDLLAHTQTTNGPDPCNLRVDNVTSSSFDVHVDEEDSTGDGTAHTTETVGYIAFD